MSDIHKRDFISFLPYEILSDILKEAFKDHTPPLVPISRAFLDFQRKAFFRHVKISSSAQFESLLIAHDEDVRLGGMIKVLELKNVDTQESRNERRLKSFFSTLVNLERLELGTNCSSIVSLVTSLRIARSELRRLESLQLHIPSNVRNPFDSEVYRYLDAYPSLRRLVITYYGDRLFTCKLRGGRPVARITELVLKGPTVDHPSILSFVNIFPNITTLALDTIDYLLPDYSDLVSTLPRSLTSLALRTSGLNEDNYRPCDQYLPRLANLEELYLGHGTFSLDVSDNLGRLPKLRTLGFGPGAIIDCTSLEALALDLKRSSSLQKLILDQVEGRIGWRINEDSDGATLHSTSETSRNHVGPGWVLPVWSLVECTEDDVKALVNRLRTQEVEVEGSTVEALGVREKYAIEVKRCLLAHATQTGDFGECRRRFGDEVVDAHLLNDAR